MSERDVRPALYNDVNPFVLEWMRTLEQRGHIAPGKIDGRSIKDLTPADVAGPGQRHFFAGIGGWSYVFRRAGIPDRASAWSGSCPCQSLSDAGKKRGFDDERHLWPEWFRLIQACLPPILFGEQSASALGLQWLDLVCDDLEGAGYTVGATDLGAASVGAPHIRQRLYFVAVHRDFRIDQWWHDATGGLGSPAPDWLAHNHDDGREEQRAARVHDHGQPGNDALGHGEAGGMADGGSTGRERSAQRTRRRDVPRERGEAGGMADNEGIGRGSRGRGIEDGRSAEQPPGRGPARGVGNASRHGTGEHAGELHGDEADDHPSVTASTACRGPWSGAGWIWCQDGRARPIESGALSLAHGIPRGLGSGGYRGESPAFTITASEARFFSVDPEHGPKLALWIAGSYVLAKQRKDEETICALRGLASDRGALALLETTPTRIPEIWKALRAEDRAELLHDLDGFGIVTSHPLAVDEPKRGGRLRGYGNAINTEQALVFVTTALASIAQVQGWRP